MLTYPNIDPVAISIGPLSVHWYGLMYLIGFTIAYYMMLHRAKQPNSGWNKDQVGDLIFFSAMGVVLGGRTGYVLFYNFDKFLSDPLWLFAVWEVACPSTAVCWVWPLLYFYLPVNIKNLFMV